MGGGVWLLLGLVDPAGAGQRGWTWSSVEPVAVAGVGGGEDERAGGVDLLGPAGVHDVGGE